MPLNQVTCTQLQCSAAASPCTHPKRCLKHSQYGGMDQIIILHYCKVQVFRSGKFYYTNVTVTAVSYTVHGKVSPKSIPVV